VKQFTVMSQGHAIMSVYLYKREKHIDNSSNVRS